MKKLRGIFSRGKGHVPRKAAEGDIAAKYRSFRHLLSHNKTALTAIADMEQLYYSGKPFSLTTIRIKYEELLEAVTGILYAYGALSGRDIDGLSEKVSGLDEGLFHYFNPYCNSGDMRFILPFESITPDMRKIVGGKAANLAAIHNLIGLPVPPAFSVTARAFDYFVEHNGLSRYLKEEFVRISSGSTADLAKAGVRLRRVFLDAEVPPLLEKEILGAYAMLEKATHAGVRIAMRSSAVGEDAEASFAGQYETVLNINKGDILDAYKRVIASKYSVQAITYRQQHGLFDRETPMCVIGIVMIDSKASGVLYSVDPLSPQSSTMRINSLWGVGEHLVDGSASPDIFVIGRETLNILERHIAAKTTRLVSLESGGVLVEGIGADEAAVSSLDDAQVIALADWGLRIEEFFSSPQDVEWALDANGSFYILQSRPLHLPNIVTGDRGHNFIDSPVIFSGGITASPGVATGRVYIVEKVGDLNQVPGDAILISRTASPKLAAVMGRVRGIITDIGSATSHMSSVAREFGIPALVDTGIATGFLTNGEIITMSATDATVYKGVVESLAKEMRPARNPMFDSPVHRLTRDIIDKISPLRLTDPEAPQFAPEGCATYHDIIRYTHEMAVRSMFGISGHAGSSKSSVELISSIPLSIRLIDMGGGLKEGFADSGYVPPDSIKSVPMLAVWKGFTHPGVNWEGTMNLGGSKLAGLLAVTATSELGEQGTGESYALISSDYLNMNARFAYHFATIDTLCGESSSHNYISLEFSGGAGNYYGRSLRARLISDILERMGFTVALKGDLVGASFSRFDRRATEERLALTAGLLASCRLLDMTLSNQDVLAVYTEEFFKGNYDFLAGRRDDELRNFYVQGGHWKRLTVDGRNCCMHDGSRWGRRVASGLSGLVGKVVGNAYRDFLDTMEAYYYFPMAVAKGIEISSGAVHVKIKPLAGNIDRAAGIAVAIKNIDNYFVLRTNALKGDVVLFEYRNGRRIARCSVRKNIETGVWHRLSVEIDGDTLKGSLNGEQVLEHRADTTLHGFVGLWTKSDSVIYFDEFTVETSEGKQAIEF
ncbi:MAG: PEP/pyruvate-binding domain-containing protein [Dissulfurispiraceae bacterium]